jgi:lipopolysaccharide export system ATP-binding protein
MKALSLGNIAQGRDTMTNETEPLLSAEGLVKSYGRRRVVDGVVLDVMPGEIVGLLGPNGAGKTTTFRMICGQVKPDRGRVFLDGVEVTRWPMYLRSRKGGMGYLPQKSSVLAKLTCEQNLRGMMQLLGFSRREQKDRTQELLERFDITHIRKSRAGHLSGGERRRLEIARCLVANPKIIMLDEPFAGIDPVTVQSIQVVIRELADDGIAILITDHAAREILQITDRTYVVSAGQILCSGSAEEIVRHETVREKYLGEIDIDSINGVGASKESSATVRIDSAAGETEMPGNSKIVFSKPRSRKLKRVGAPFKSDDLS